jgi:hypothetical protein
MNPSWTYVRRKSSQEAKYASIIAMASVNNKYVKRFNKGMHKGGANLAYF